MRVRRAGIVLLVAAALTGCGSSGNKTATGLTSGQQQGLVAQLEAVRGAAAAHNLSATERVLARFRSSVAHLRRSGTLTSAAARELRIGAARILARAKSDNPPAPQPTTTTTTPTPVAPAPAKHGPKPKAPKPPKGPHGHDHGKGHG
jgi:hypothetical protein